MNTPAFKVLLADLCTKTSHSEFLTLLLKGISLGEISCNTKEIITPEIFKERLTMNIPFQVFSLAEKEIQWDMFQHYQNDLTVKYSTLLEDLLQDEVNPPYPKYEELKKIEATLKATLPQYDVNSRSNFSKEFYFKVIPPDAASSDFIVTFNQLELSEDALHYLNDLFKVRHELINELLQITEQNIVQMNAILQKSYSFELEQTKGAMLIAEFVVALTDEKKGLLKHLDKNGKHTLAKKMSDLFGLTYEKWLEHDVLRRDDPAKHLTELCNILSEKKYPKRFNKKNN